MSAATIAAPRAAETTTATPAATTAATTSAARPAVPAGKDQPPGVCAAFARLGDAVALIDQRRRRLSWTSPAWQAWLPELAAGTNLEALQKALPGLTVTRCEERGETSPALWVGDNQQWEAQLTPLEPGLALLRLADRREQGRALQRQLDDREQLLFTSRVISVGEMATTLAHELNQPIGATSNLLRGLRSRLARRPGALEAEEAEALDRALDQVIFASRVIARIREFTHSHQPRHARFDLVKLLRSSASLLDWDLRRTGARLTLDLPEADVHVRGDAVMLQQVVVNLMRNALDALRTDPPDDPHVALRLAKRADEVEVTVCDNGCGLGDEAEAKLFVPFASTKPTGMGIGLSICRSFVELHQGRLWFSRNTDRGATFHVSLPLQVAKPKSTP